MNNTSNNSTSSGWGGLTIKEILEKVDLFNVTVDDGNDGPKADKSVDNKRVNKDGKTVVVSASEPESAYLGLKLWDRSIDDAEFSIMNIDDFLKENNLSVDDEAIAPQSPSGIDVDTSLLRSEEPVVTSSLSNPRKLEDERKRTLGQKKKHTPLRTTDVLPKDSDTDFLYAESKRARLDRERSEKKRRHEVAIDFEPEDLALATIPGANFDPKKRSFSADELKPQPIIRKRKKHYVPSENKDDRYWEKRAKNNLAARRSREARRLKENQIALRAAFLERENEALKRQVADVLDENKLLRSQKNLFADRLSHYEKV